MAAAEDAPTERPSRRPRWLSLVRSALLRPIGPIGVAVVVVGVFATAELGVRATEEHLPPPRLGDEEELFVKADQISAMHEAGERTDIVFLGASGMDAGIDPELIEQQSGSITTAYNASIVAFPVRYMAQWLDDVVLPGLRPAVVVVGIHPFQLGIPTGKAARTQRGYETAFDATLAEISPDLVGKAEVAAAEASYLVRFRLQLRDPSAVTRGVIETFTDAPPPLETVNARYAKPRDYWASLLSPKGWNNLYEQVPDEVLIDPVMAQRFEDMVAGGYSLDPVEGILQLLLDAGVSPVLVVPPLDRATLHGSGMDLTLFDPIVTDLGALAGRLGVPFVNYDLTPFDPYDFHDKAHLDRRGTERFSADLARRLDELCAAAAIPACANRS